MIINHISILRGTSTSTLEKPGFIYEHKGHGHRARLALARLSCERNDV